MTFAAVVRSLVDGPTARQSGQDHERSSLGDWMQSFSYQNARYLLGGNSTYGPAERTEQMGERDAYTSNGIVFALVGRRVDLFSQAEFRWKRAGSGHKPMSADLFDTPALEVLENPVDLLAGMEEDHSWAGNAYAVRDGGAIRRLVPWWCSIVLGSERLPDDPAAAWDARPVGLIYHPGGQDNPAGREVFLWDEVAHYASRRDPEARYRGMSWLRPVLVEAENTSAQNRFIQRFYEAGATPNQVVTFQPETTLELIEAFRDRFLEKHQGVDRSFRTAFLGGGADLKVVGSNLSELASRDLNADQFARMCAAAGVPPIVVTIVPGLESASTYANYATALRSFADITMRPLWYRAALKLRALVSPTPPGAELWYDVSSVSALQSDALDDAGIAQQQAGTMRTLIDGGFDPDSVVAAVTTGDMTRLVHTKLVSVQLNPPGMGMAEPVGMPAGMGVPA